MAISLGLSSVISIFGYMVNSNYYDIKEDQNIIVIFYPEIIKLKAKVVYVKTNGGKCSFGVNFEKTDKEKYQDILINK